MNTSVMNATQPEAFGAGQSVINVTDQFNGEDWHESGEGLSTGYLHANCLENVTNDGPWDTHYEGSGHNLGLYRDPEKCYWNLHFNEAEQSYKLHYVGKREDAIALVADFRVRVWDEGMSAEWLVVDDQPHVINSGGVPESVIQSATDVLWMHVQKGNVGRHSVVEPDITQEFVGDGEEDDYSCEIEDLR